MSSLCAVCDCACVSCVCVCCVCVGVQGNYADIRDVAKEAFVLIALHHYVTGDQLGSTSTNIQTYVELKTTLATLICDGEPDKEWRAENLTCRLPRTLLGVPRTLTGILREASAKWLLAHSTYPMEREGGSSHQAINLVDPDLASLFKDDDDDEEEAPQVGAKSEGGGEGDGG